MADRFCQGNSRWLSAAVADSCLPANRSIIIVCHLSNVLYDAATAHAWEAATVGFPVTFFEILGHDAGQLSQFYGAAFGWRVSEPGQTMDYREFETGSKEGIQGGVGKAPKDPGWITFYVAVPDVPALLAKIEGLGGKTVMPPFKTARGDLTVAYFADPEGHVVGLFSE